MESPVQGRPNRETGLPPGVEVGPLGRRFVAYLINVSVPAIASTALIYVLVAASGSLRLTLALLTAAITIGWIILVWYLLAVSAASPGLRAMKLQVVGFLDGRPIGPARVFLRALVFWAVYLTGIGLLIMLIMMLRHPRKQGWHDLAVTAVMIKERVLAPSVQPARAVTGAQQGPPIKAGAGSQPYPSGVAAAMPPVYTPGENYAHAGTAAPPGQLTPPSGMAPTTSGAHYAAPVPPGGSASPYSGNAYGTSYAGTPYAPQSGDELYAPGQLSGPVAQAPQGFASGTSPAQVGTPENGTANGEAHEAAVRSPYVQDWSILLDDGRRITLDGLVLLGRNPQPKAGEEDAQLIKIADESRTVSKSHLAVGVDAGGVYVVDRGSTNGSTVSTTNGMSARCRAGEMVRVGDGAIISIGDHWLEITRGS
jgi:uncharacterized RDD family membrane protein YckC